MIQEPFRIDVHHHMVPPEYVAALTAFGVKGGEGIDFPHWDSQSSLSMMDRQRVERENALALFPRLKEQR